ncbi:PAAR domain-containing protein [Paraburkholderia megapolitana]|uniref:Zn-binding Pro-Ala-Ala-Arg (PAAR) domain-containing protein, incolved in TypeVI secretion n=1 Tax=Paraburkholderia megapolitana TaxID=420953 RepID=A0A1I3VCA5_9BURK|nr:PAAR domain-containing protein [Paraburkholderia megapolitana]QDQ85492.1 PAAR domain-containing protein [Paraburkholderia megapolitana]SFJ92915.1 Zn-binding Pro-Ala-Ala-Arg (PAAR) domain-containing protein, incolved in TypeVI secretion [Paraburkholderia megapolitana]
MRGIIRVGDTHSHGGLVETGAPNSEVMGRAPARKSDLCTCPMHGAVVIAEGDGDFQIDGVAASFEGHKTSCGAVLISSLPSSGRT